MILIAFLIGIYSYAILLLGMLGSLYPMPVAMVTISFLTGLIYTQRENILRLNFTRNHSWIDKGIICILVCAILVNSIGALGPELAFDALWYHATFAKIYASTHIITYLPGSLFHYSLMPRLTEMLYAAVFTLDLYNFSKIIHLIFGILASLMLYRLARLYLSKKYSLFAVLIFYTNLVVMWLSITAYSDLSRTFFEIGALYYFLRYWKNNSRKILLASSVFLGFAICTKLVSIGTLIIFGIFIIFRKCVLKEKLGDLALLLTVSLGLAMPWFLTSYFYTANPFYPVLSELQLPHSPVVLLSPLVFLKTFINAFLFSPDPISPFYLSFLPLLLGKFKPIVKKHGILLLLSLASYIMWYATSQTGGARFLTSYIPLYTVLGLLVIKEYKKGIIYFFVAVTVIVICLNISYRFVANAKYIPVILGIQSRQVFLMNQLNFDFGDFYDENGEIAAIVGDDKVLLVNMHNLFYVDFPFTLAEWRGRDYKYILVQKSQLPEVYKDALLIYKNDKTHVKLYKL